MTLLPGQIDREALLHSFMVETNEGLKSLEATLVRLEGETDNAELLDEVFRILHTLKGNAAMLGLASVSDVAHAAEDLLVALRERRLELTSARITLLLRTVDALRHSAAAEAVGAECDAAAKAALIAALHGTDTLEVTPMAQSTHTVRAPGRRREDIDAYIDRLQSMRVDVARLDALLDLIGEVAISRSRVRQAVQRGAAASDDIRAAFSVHEQLLADLQDLVMRLRMVPVGPTFRQLLRPVRDMALTSGKQACLVSSGEDVEVDMSVVEQLKDPLTHMIRNAIDHGIEDPEQRRAHGKNPRGTVSLAARHEGGSIVIEVSDDGAGLDLPRIAERARELGHTVPDQGLPLDEAQRLICEPGFSTSRAVTELSGRGVGLDVVRQRVERLRGTISLRSRPGLGTTFTLRLPLTLAVLDAFAVAVAGETLLIPTDVVVECLAFSAAKVESDGSGMIELRGEPLPYTRLRTRLGLADTAAEREQLVVVKHATARIGLIVDEVLSQEQTVIKPLGSFLRNVSGIAGCTVLGSGRVALILDVPSIVATLLEGLSQAENALAVPFAEVRDELPVS
jgi:two-component system, chemotaxis family, sensor kinase CheA